MKERKGHRKLRLCNTKNYESKKYPKKLLVSIPRDDVSVLPVSVPLSLLSFQVSLPLSANTVLSARSFMTECINLAIFQKVAIYVLILVCE